MSVFDSIREAFLARLRRTWIAAVLILGILAGLVSSLEAVRWYRDNLPWIVLALLGAAYGLLLAGSRFRNRSAFTLNAFTAIGLTLLFVGRVLPPPETALGRPLLDSIWLTHVRFTTWLSRLADGFGSLLRGEGIGDVSVLVTLVGLIAWHAGVWLVWCVARRRQALAGVAACGGLLAANILSTGRDATFPVTFIACSVLLIGYTAYVERTRDWNRRQVDYPELVREDWLLNGALLSIVIIGLAIVTTPDVRRGIRDLFTIKQPAPSVAGSSAAAGFPEARFTLTMPDMRTIGIPIPDSLATVMWVSISDPAPPPPEVESTSPVPRHYWRGAIFATYIGTGWEPPAILDERPPLAELPPAVPPGRYALTQTYEIVSPHDGNLMAVGSPVVASAGTSLRSVAPDGDVLLHGEVSTYTVTSWATQVTQAGLRGDSTDYPPDIRDAYLQLPDSLPPRVRDLAARIVEGAITPYDKAVRIQDYLRLSYAYTLDVPSPPAGSDAVDYFLFEAPGGFCSYYASAMAAMLRAEGVPARLVTGFAMGEFDYERGAYRVSASASHAWVEVYFPTYGWVEFEPTAALGTFDYPAGDSPALALTPAPQPIEIILPSGSQIAQWGIIVLAAAGVIFAAALWRRSQRRRFTQVSPPHAQYWRMRRTLNRAGVRASATVTPNEFLALSRARLADRNRLLEAVQRMTALYIDATYRSRAPGEADLRASRRAWWSALPQCLGLWLRNRVGVERKGAQGT